MKEITHALYILLRVALTESTDVAMPNNINWHLLYKTAQMQGVAAIAMDGLQLLMNAGYIPVGLDAKEKLKWYAASVAIDKSYERQFVSARELASVWKGFGIRTLLLKGFAFAAYYPKPSHRPASDMDCYLCGRYEDGNKAVEALGISVSREDYRHSTFRFDNVFVENHKICTTVRGKKQRKRFEVYLRSLLENEETQALGDSCLEKPCDRFNALFFLQHSHRHFLREGITLRYVCDWAMIIGKARCFDDEFWRVCRANDLEFFALTMTRLANVVCGLKAPWLQGGELFKQDRLLLADCYNISKNAICYGNKWVAHVQIAKNMLGMRWKYKWFSSRSFFIELLTSVWANWFDKAPNIPSVAANMHGLTNMQSKKK